MTLPIYIEEQLLSNGWNLTVQNQVSGGNINQAVRLSDLNNQYYFLKYNNTSCGNDILKSELEGLSLLSSVGISVPVIREANVSGQIPYLLMDWIDTAPRSNQAIAELLVHLHRLTADDYGLDTNNRIGTLAQYNIRADSFFNFYTTQRLLPQIKLAHDNGLQLGLSADRLNQILKNHIPEEKPTLIHGDLWSGNIMDTTSGPVLIDPSVSYCHREMDLAMMQLFGGFDKEIFELYDEAFPLSEDWQSRQDLFQLYYLLVHYNIFGASYAQAATSIIDKYMK